MKIILLGTGTSTGIPEVGCSCGLCQSPDVRDQRLRTSALIVTDTDKRILIDVGPDFRQQALRVGLDRVDAILLTHEHYDHVYGLDDLRTIAWKQEIPIYGQARVLDAVRERMHYVFGAHPYPGAPRLRLIPIDGASSVEICGVTVTPIEVLHGVLPILGYRIGALAYITDMKTISPEHERTLGGVRLLVINALRELKPHPSHQSIRDLHALLGRLPGRPELTLLTHLSHHAPMHSLLEKTLPEDIRPGYDFACCDLSEAELSLSPFERQALPYEFRDCGKISYAEAWSMQRELFDRILAQKAAHQPTDSFLLLCEHFPVFTLGQHGDKANLLMSEDFLREQGYDWFQVERGGDITYHGPGQITGYPILDLEKYGLGLRAYIELMEASVIEVLAMLGIVGDRKSGATGVWLDPDDPERARKICAIGVRSSRFVTMHGFALNVNTDLTPFGLINPCGFRQGKVTSIAQELGGEVDFTVIKRLFEARFSARLRERMPNPLNH